MGRLDDEGLLVVRQRLDVPPHSQPSRHTGKVGSLEIQGGDATVTLLLQVFGHFSDPLPLDQTTAFSRRLRLCVAGQGAEAQVDVTGEGGAGTEVGAVRSGRGGGPGGGAPHLAARTPAERHGTVFH